MPGRGHVRRGEFLHGAGGGERALQMHRLVEQLVTDEDHQGEEPQLEVAADAHATIKDSNTVSRA